MDWATFLLAKQLLDVDDVPPLLVMEGVVNDNATRYLLLQKGVLQPNNFDILLSGNHVNKDFVWCNGKGVRVAGQFDSGGHPALAGFDAISCAGRIEEDGFFFHSGHYKPKLPAILYFIADQIETTCAGLTGATRDAKVDEIATRRFRLYHRSSETSTYTTSFDLEYREASGPLVTGFGGTATGSSAPISIGRSKPVTIGRSTPMTISNNNNNNYNYNYNATPSTSMLTSSIGITTTGISFSTTRIAHNRARWVPDSEVTSCQSCHVKFTLTKRRHHCRKCGNIFCNDCTSQTMVVRYPATEGTPDDNTINTEAVRVCGACYTRRDL